MCGVGHGPIVRRGGAGGGERRALQDPIGLTIVVRGLSKVYSADGTNIKYTTPPCWLMV